MELPGALVNMNTVEPHCRPTKDFRKSWGLTDGAVRLLVACSLARSEVGQARKGY